MVKYNNLSVLIGKKAIELSTYIGVLVHKSIPILYNNWCKVLDDTKERLWGSRYERVSKVLLLEWYEIKGIFLMLLLLE